MSKDSQATWFCTPSDLAKPINTIFAFVPALQNPLDSIESSAHGKLYI